MNSGFKEVVIYFGENHAVNLRNTLNEFFNHRTLREKQYRFKTKNI